MGVKYSLFLKVDDNSARWGWSILYSFVRRLQIVGDNFDRWGSIRNVCLLSSSSIYNQICQNIILGLLQTVICELCGSYRENISFKLKFNNIKTWLKICKNRYHEKQVHTNETNEQRDHNQHIFMHSIETDTLQWKSILLNIMFHAPMKRFQLELIYYFTYFYR